MNDLETGKDKIKKICEILKNESLEPAKKESQKILSEAEEKAKEIIDEAKKVAEEIYEANKEKMKGERAIFESSLNQACKQGVETLRQLIMQQLFNNELSDWVRKQVVDPKIASQLIEVLIKAVEKEGISADFSAVISSKISAEQVNALLAKNVLEKLKEKSVTLGNFKGGIQIKLHDQNLILDMSDQALIELMEKYLRKDFRDLLFKKVHEN